MGWRCGGARSSSQHAPVDAAPPGRRNLVGASAPAHRGNGLAARRDTAEACAHDLGRPALLRCMPRTSLKAGGGGTSHPRKIPLQTPRSPRYLGRREGNRSRPELATRPGMYRCGPVGRKRRGCVPCVVTCAGRLTGLMGLGSVASNPIRSVARATGVWLRLPHAQGPVGNR